jgi:uncharacterized protein YcgL (UPF0745 family)
VRCFVYRSSKKADTYLYLPVAGDFSAIPTQLMTVFGKPELALELVLTPDRKLAAEDARTVLRNLMQRGFHLQLPPSDFTRGATH